jgi:hypothetical protein
MAMGALAQTGCESPSPVFGQNQNQRSAASPGSLSAQPHQRGKAFSREQRSAITVAFAHWEQHVRDRHFTYEIDPFDPRLPYRFRQSLQSKLPQTSSADPEQHRVIAFERVEFPRANWAFVAYRESNRYHALEYTDVLRWENNTWVLQDHFLVAEGLLDTVIMDFQWLRYVDVHLGEETPSEP